MFLRRHLSAFLSMSLTLSGSLLFAQVPTRFSAQKDVYPDREALLKDSFRLCSELFSKERPSDLEAFQIVQKYIPLKLDLLQVNHDRTGWTLDIKVIQLHGGLLRLIKNDSFFTLSYRQSESTIEPIASISLSERCLNLNEARFTYYNSSYRPYQRVKINSSYQQVQSVIMEEPVRQVKANFADQMNRILIGVIDSGVDYNHSTLITKTRPMIGIDLTNPKRPPYDYTNTVQNELMGRRFTHGTAVADIASRNINALIVPVRIENQSKLSGEAVEYLAQKGVRLVNLSQGTFRLADWLAFKEAVIKHPEMLFVVSAGNESKNIDMDPVYPSAFEIPNMIVVASINREGKLSSFSNYGPRRVHFAALGENVTAASAGGGEWTVSGTSFAAPLVANMIAQMLIQNPELKPQEVKALLIQKAQYRPELKDKVQFGVLE